MLRRIALISCTKSKTDYPASARELYSASALFRKALAYVEPHADEVFVLSAKYGLVTLEQPLAPYEQTLKAMGVRQQREWAEQVFSQIRKRFGDDLAGIVFEFHTGVEYRTHLEKLLTQAGATCTCPVEGLAIGERLAFYGGNQPPSQPRKTPSPGPAGSTAAPRELGPFERVWARIEAPCW